MLGDCCLPTNKRTQGHFEFFLCDTQDLDDPDGAVDQECFNKNPLTRAYNASDASIIDPNYEGRYHLDPPCRAAGEIEQNVSSNFDSTREYDGVPYGTYTVKMRYMLPDVECEHCVLQMRWRESPCDDVSGWSYLETFVRDTTTMFGWVSSAPRRRLIVDSNVLCAAAKPRSKPNSPHVYMYQ